MKKLIVVFFVLLTLVATVTGCTTEKYEIKKVNDIYYLYLRGLSDEKIQEIVDGCEAAPYVEFTSIEEMIDKLTSGKVPYEEMVEFVCYQSEGVDGIQICDLDTMLQPQIPEEMSYNVRWYGARYVFNLFSEDQRIGYISEESKDFYDILVARFSNYGEYLSNRTLVSDVTLQEIAGETCTYKYVESARNMKARVYTLEVSGTRLYIEEVYALEESELIPESLWIYGESNGIYFLSCLENFEIQPSTDWLSQFSLTPYVLS